MARPVRVVHPTGAKILLWVGSLSVGFGVIVIALGGRRPLDPMAMWSEPRG